MLSLYGAAGILRYFEILELFSFSIFVIVCGGLSLMCGFFCVWIGLLAGVSGGNVVGSVMNV